MHAVTRLFAVAGTGAALCASIGTSVAAEPEVSCTGLDYAQRRVLEHSYQGIDALRRYVIITRPVHQIGMSEVVASLDQWRAAAQCSTTSADAATRVRTAKATIPD